MVVCVTIVLRVPKCEKPGFVWFLYGVLCFFHLCAETWYQACEKDGCKVDRFWQCNFWPWTP